MNFNSYLIEIRKNIIQSLCIQHFSSQTVERHSKPEIEIKYLNAWKNILYILSIF